MKSTLRRAARLALILFCAACSASPAPSAPANVTTLTPQRIPLSAPEIANPGRGLYRWREQTMMCPAELKSDMDAYNRWTWAELEPDPGRYDWAAVRAFIDAAVARKQRVWLGLGTSAGPAEHGPYLPDHLRQPGWGDVFAGEWYPDYDHPEVRLRLEAMLDSFMREFPDEPHIAGIQMLSYGRYGEGYLPWDAPPEHAMWVSESGAEWLIDAWHDRVGGRYQLSIPVSDDYHFHYALTRQPPWGLIRNALGLDEQMVNLDAVGASQAVVGGLEVGPAMAERWKIAPVFTEMIGEAGDRDYSGQFAAAPTQVVSYHVSLVSNGNFAHPYKEGPWDFWPSGEDCPQQASAWTEQNVGDFVLAGKLSGYRYAPARLLVEQSGPDLAISTEWVNEGVAPIYADWTVRFELRPLAAADTVAWSADSAASLREILPTPPDRPAVVSDRFGLPADLPAGRYWLHMVIPPPPGYFAPLRLAVTGEQPDGGYRLGEILIACSTNGSCQSSK